MRKKQILKFTVCFSFLLLISCCLFFNPSQGKDAKIKTNLTWSTNTYVPFNYSGKALPVPGSLVEVTANLEERPSIIRKLDFYWFLNNQLQNQAYSKGKHTFKFLVPSSGSRTLSIKLEVKDQGKLVVSKKLSIKTVAPQVIIYSKQNSFLAIKDHKIPNHQQVKFEAIPYFFNIQNLNNLDYQWTLNNKKADEFDQSPNILTLGIEIEGLIESITQKLELLVKNKDKSNQEAKIRTTITIIP